MKQWGGDQNYRPEKRDKDKPRRSRRDCDKAPKTKERDKKEKVAEAKIEDSSAQSERDYRVGRTIAGATDNSRQRSLEHIAARKKRLRRKILVTTIVLAVISVIAATIARSVAENVALNNTKTVETKNYPTNPTVPILDENAGSNISTRVRTFVARLEADAIEYGLKVDHVLLPFQRAREIRVYFVGRNEYYKMTTERGSTVQVEDAERMVRHLEGKGIAPEYVDIRIAGKAYYK